MKFRHTNFMRLIYATLLALPFVAILSRVIYVQSNKNAYKSYYGETINDKTLENVNYENLVASNTYNLVPNLITFNNDETTGQSATKFYFSNAVLNSNEVSDTYSYFRIYAVSNTTSLLIYSDDGQSRLEYAFGNITSFEFNYEYQVNDDDKGFLYQLDFTYYVYNDYSYMDNVFEYSVNKFIQNNNFGKINLFQWTTDLFFDSNDVNNMYVGFINWYLNYTLLVSATYILFLVLMWFINYARRLLERGMNYDW